VDDVVRFYSEHSDEERLSSGWGLIEFARSQEIIARHLPAAELPVLDVGGGTGVYAEWLGSLGHRAHLIDLTPSHIATARTRRKHIASAEIGDARRLSWADRSVDAVLLLGPLYHLVDRPDRVTALREARRVLRPGGLVFAAAICRFAPLLGSLVDGFFDDPAFAPVLARDLEDGQHRNTTGDPRRFTTAYFHRPEELVEELREAGLGVVDCLAIEGPVGWRAGRRRRSRSAGRMRVGGRG
jgi:ubiquinone/menaquinone biosynthesis C-methylase UbiE